MNSSSTDRSRSEVTLIAPVPDRFLTHPSAVDLGPPFNSIRFLWRKLQLGEEECSKAHLRSNSMRQPDGYDPVRRRRRRRMIGAHQCPPAGRRTAITNWQSRRGKVRTLTAHNRNTSSCSWYTQSWELYWYTSPCTVSRTWIDTQMILTWTSGEFRVFSVSHCSHHLAYVRTKRLRKACMCPPCMDSPAEKQAAKTMMALAAERAPCSDTVTKGEETPGGGHLGLGQHFQPRISFPLTWPRRRDRSSGVLCSCHRPQSMRRGPNAGKEAHCSLHAPFAPVGSAFARVGSTCMPLSIGRRNVRRSTRRWSVDWSWRLFRLVSSDLNCWRLGGTPVRPLPVELRLAVHSAVQCSAVFVFFFPPSPWAMASSACVTSLPAKMSVH